MSKLGLTRNRSVDFKYSTTWTQFDSFGNLISKSLHSINYRLRNSSICHPYFKHHSKKTRFTDGALGSILRRSIRLSLRHAVDIAIDLFYNLTTLVLRSSSWISLKRISQNINMATSHLYCYKRRSYYFWYPRKRNRIVITNSIRDFFFQISNMSIFTRKY